MSESKREIIAALDRLEARVKELEEALHAIRDKHRMYDAKLELLAELRSQEASYERSWAPLGP